MEFGRTSIANFTKPLTKRLVALMSPVICHASCLPELISAIVFLRHLGVMFLS